jgi:hypothetical protein
MKYENLIYGLGTTCIIGGSLLKILHLPYGNFMIQFGVVVTLFYQAWHVIQLKKRIKELESNSTASNPS